MLCNFSGHVNALFDFFCINDVVALFFMWPCAYGFLLQKAHLMCVASMSQNRSIHRSDACNFMSKPYLWCFEKKVAVKVCCKSYCRILLGGFARGEGDHQPTSNRQLSPSPSLASSFDVWQGQRSCCRNRGMLFGGGVHFGSWFQHIPRIPWKDLIS